MSAAVELDALAIETSVGVPPAAEWRELNQRARAGNMFLGPEWLIPWWERFGAGRELCCIQVREGGRLIGLWPLFRPAIPITE